ncbi:MAG: hypothetical protein JW394_0210 [Nitrospira sp.]|nr:hypothetical protein [Nitrospira sp.]
MKLLFAAILHRIPAIPIEVQGRGLNQEQETIDDERGEENIGQVVHQLGVEGDQQEQQNAPEECRRGIGRSQKLGKLLGKFVVALFAGLPGDDFAHPGEDGHA